MQFSEQRLDLKAKEGEVVLGSFLVSHPKEQKVKGFLYSSNPRMTFDPGEFYGTENKIFYQMDTNGLIPGDEAEGKFTFCTDLGEYELPYRVEILREKDLSEDAAVQDTASLAALAQKDFEAAYPVFISPAFQAVVKKKEPDHFVLYQTLKNQEFSYQSMEEFLIGCGQKDPVELSIEKTEAKYYDLDQSVRETVGIRKSGWGFLRLDIQSDTRFLRVEKKVVTTDEFAGNQYELEYIIDSNFLHAGRNYGRIKIITCYQELDFEVAVVCRKDSEARRQHRVQKMMQKKLENLYIDFRLKRMEMQAWIDRTSNVINSYKRAGGMDVYADLFLVQVLFADEKRAKGYKLLQEIEQRPDRLYTPDRYGFYLYISTFFQRDVAYVDQVEARIEQLFLQNRENWVLQWILLYLQERLMRDDSAKLEVIEEQVKVGCSSPILYLEAFQLIKKDPFLLRRLEPFELKILTFGARQGILTEEIVHQVGNLAMHSRGYSKALYELLKACYEVNRSAEIVRAICTIAIAGDKKEREFFTWYALGVHLDLRITGLYEYYMETMDEQGIEQMPQIIRMYFVYNNTLDYHKRARIYRNISDNRDNVPQVFRGSREAAQKFVLEQLGMGRLDENLAVLYPLYLDRQMLTRSLAEKLLKLLFTFEVTCKNPNMKSVAVVHRNMTGEQVVPIVSGKAQVQIYTEDARILLLDGAGNRYASTSLYLAQQMLSSDRLLEFCRELVPEQPGLVLHLCSEHQGEITEELLPYYKSACGMECLEEEFKETARKKVLDYYLKHPAREDLFRYLKQISYPAFIKADKKALLTLLTQEGMYEEAFALLETYGFEHVPLKHLVRICSQTVLAKEYEENTVLLSYCCQCYDSGKYDDNILTYLLMYYDGPIEEMKRMWDTGRQFELDTMVLEEKILTLLLFTRTGSSGTEPVFASYQRKLGRRKICKAYLILRCYEYFVKDYPVNDLLFGYLEHSYRKGSELEDVNKLALLRFYSRQVSLNEAQEESAARLLAEYNARGMRFAFYQMFPKKLRLPYQLEDKVFFEVAADPANTVILCWRPRGSQEPFREEPMKDCFEGINVKEFILFKGEEIECFTKEMAGEEVRKTSDTRILRGRVLDEEENGRFALLNRALKAREEGREDQARETLSNYCQLEYLTKEIFTLI